jgi:aldose 1-epimerase
VSSASQHPDRSEATEVGEQADGRVQLRSERASVTVDPADGCRLTSFAVAGHELLSDGTDPRAVEGMDEPPFGWGCFVMAPFAGRVRDGRATWDGRTLELPRQEEPHALHGLVHSAPWDRIEATAWRIRVPVDLWFAPLEVVHRLRLDEDHLRLDLEVTTPAGPAPATVGWHPWFRRDIDGSSLELALPPAVMLERDPDGITSRRRVEVPAPPWDDAFVDLAGPVRLTWPDVTTLGIETDAPVTVVFTERASVACVEPQSGPPDEVNRSPRVVSPERPLRLSTTWRWRRA